MLIFPTSNTSCLSLFSAIQCVLSLMLVCINPYTLFEPLITSQTLSFNVPYFNSSALRQEPLGTAYRNYKLTKHSSNSMSVVPFVSRRCNEAEKVKSWLLTENQPFWTRDAGFIRQKQVGFCSFIIYIYYIFMVRYIHFADAKKLLIRLLTMVPTRPLMRLWPCWDAVGCDLRCASCSQREYPIMLATFITIATMATNSHLKSNFKMEINANKIQIAGAVYKATQNALESTGFTIRLGRDSKIQEDVPSSRTSFHQRNPTKRRPVTFFTVQKSNANNKTINTNCKINDDVKIQHSKYVTIAAVRKNK